VEFSQYIFLGVTALMLSLLMMPAAIRLSYRVGAVDYPDERKVHGQPVSRMGGMAVGAALIISILLFITSNPYLTGILAGFSVIFLTGFLDDIWCIRPAFKFCGEIVASLLFIMISGVSIESFGDLLGFGRIDLGSLSVPVTVIAMVGVINALNLSDGLDGLAGGLSAIACLFLAFFALLAKQWLCLELIVALFGSLIGFLYFNEYPAKVFMGDTGSLSLGYMLSVICVLLANNHSGQSAYPVSMAIILGLPIVDTLLVMGRRIWYGNNPFLPDKTHLHHRLLSLGAPHAAVVSIIYILMAAFGMLAIVLYSFAEWIQLLAGMSLALLCFGSVMMMQRYTGRLQGFGASTWHEIIKPPVFSRISAIAGMTVPVMKWIIPTALLIPVLFLSPESNTTSIPAFAIIITSLVLFPWQSERDRTGWIHGLIYLATFVILFMLNMYGPEWIGTYLAGFSIFLVLWVVLKVLFNDHSHVFIASGFELMMILVSWMLPVFATRIFAFPADIEAVLSITCLQAICFLFAEKVLIRKQPRRNRFLLAGLMLGLSYIAIIPML